MNRFIICLAAIGLSLFYSCDKLTGTKDVDGNQDVAVNEIEWTPTNLGKITFPEEGKIAICSMGNGNTAVIISSFIESYVNDYDVRFATGFITDKIAIDKGVIVFPDKVEGAKVWMIQMFSGAEDGLIFEKEYTADLTIKGNMSCDGDDIDSVRLLTGKLKLNLKPGRDKEYQLYYSSLRREEYAPIGTGL